MCVHPEVTLRSDIECEVYIGYQKPIKEPEHLISAEEFEPPQTQSPQRSLIVFLRYTPAKELARASNIPGIDPVLEHLKNADESEIQGSSQPSEIDQEPEVSEPFNAAEAIQEPQVLPQTLGLVKVSNSLIWTIELVYRKPHLSLPTLPSTCPLTKSELGSDLVKGRNQWRNVLLQVPPRNLANRVLQKIAVRVSSQRPWASLHKTSIHRNLLNHQVVV
ncbi:hypothetical protein VE00_04320 [Pseudogymnoascus sp. WSF 3629]|nr:hypothetical protein VE00_04320 [Pseudogymnoascus sp. WSF 3629]